MGENAPSLYVWTRCSRLECGAKATMNKYLTYSLEYAAQRSYLDDLFRVYPTIPNGLRDVDPEVWNRVEVAFKKQDHESLIRNMLDMELFPIKDSYVAYLRKDTDAIARNPRTVSRLASRLYELGIDKVYENATEPKETNRQMGSCFKTWISSGALGLCVQDLDTFVSGRSDAILNASDAQMKDFAHRELNYNREKGLDFVARVNGRYVIGEAKFLTDFGGHQNAQFNDAIATLTAPNVKAVQIAILDGVVYIPGNNKMYRTNVDEYAVSNIMSALVLREFIYEL